MRREIVGVMLAMLLASIVTLAFNIQPARASITTIYIRADGRIDPPDAPISTTDRVTYTMTANIYGRRIVVERSNIVFDGKRYTLQGPGSGIGIYLPPGVSGVTIKNTNIKNYGHGIVLGRSSNNTVSGNNITANKNYGIWLDSSSNNRISGNNIANNDYDGIMLDYSSGNTVSGNNIAANNWKGIRLSKSSNNHVSGNNVTANNEHGISLSSSSDNRISGNTFVNDGLYVWRSYRNSVEGNTVNGRPLVYLEGVSNRVVGDAGQVVLVRCRNIRVEGLSISRTSVGVLLVETSNSTISGNSIAANNWYGIFLQNSSNNRIYHNNFTNNRFQAGVSYGFVNTWDDGYPSGGNYWSDYRGRDEKRGPRQDQPGSDGIGDTPHVISGQNIDRYPLMNPIKLDKSPPTTTHDYDGSWRSSDFTITLKATDDKSGVAETHYRINDGPTKRVSVDGQPRITTEGSNNRLEYWSVDKAGNEEPRKVLTGIKLDKTHPTIETPSRTPAGDVPPDKSVNVSARVTDAASQVKNVTLYYTVDGGATWTGLPMSLVGLSLYRATIPQQRAGATVRFRIVAYDNAGNTATLEGGQLEYRVTQEFLPFLIPLLLVMIILIAAIIYKRKRPPPPPPPSPISPVVP